MTIKKLNATKGIKKETFEESLDAIYTTMKALLDIIESTYKNNQCIIVTDIFKNKDKHYDRMEVHIFEDFVDTNDFINNKIRDNINYQLDIYQFFINKNSYTKIISTTKHGSVRNYYRPKTVKEYGLFYNKALIVAKKFYYLDIDIFLHTKD